MKEEDPFQRKIDTLEQRDNTQRVTKPSDDRKHSMQCLRDEDRDGDAGVDEQHAHSNALD